jgi:hypothetical protein
MSDSYPDQLYEAAEIYSSSCNAYANFRAGGTAGSYIALRIQAPEIMMQFVGDVDFGKGTSTSTGHFLGLSDV